MPVPHVSEDIYTHMVPCACCGEPYCTLCDEHYADCNCYLPGHAPEDDE